MSLGSWANWPCWADDGLIGKIVISKGSMLRHLLRAGITSWSCIFFSHFHFKYLKSPYGLLFPAGIWIPQLTQGVYLAFPWHFSSYLCETDWYPPFQAGNVRWHTWGFTQGLAGTGLGILNGVLFYTWFRYLPQHTWWDVYMWINDHCYTFKVLISYLIPCCSTYINDTLEAGGPKLSHSKQELYYIFLKFSVILFKVYLNFWICWDQFARQERILSQLRQTQVARHSSAIYSALAQPEGWAQNSSSSVLLCFQASFSWPLPGKLLLSGPICSVWCFKVLLLKVGVLG